MLSRYHEGGTVTFRDDSKGEIIDIGNIKIGSSPLIENVVLVEGLKHNLIANFMTKVLKLFLIISLVIF